jgi:hypothetical protein
LEACGPHIKMVGSDGHMPMNEKRLGAS